MHMFKVALILFAKIASCSGQLDIAPEFENRGATVVDRYNSPVSVKKDRVAKINSLNVAADNETLSISLYNNLANGVFAYIVGKDVNNRVIILQPDGTFYHPDANGATVSVKVTEDIRLPLGAPGSTFSIKIPTYISSARIYFATGELQFFIVSINGETTLIEPSAVNPTDPSATINWGFIELTHLPSGVWANISCVDFVGLPLGISLSTIAGTVQSTAGLTANAVASICDDLYEQATKDGQPWNKLCQTNDTGTAIRVLAPINYIRSSPNAFSSYWTEYINQVWLFYTSTPLIIDTQLSRGKVQCKVLGDVLTCVGDNRGYVKPTAFDIFSCNTGPFEILAPDNDIHRAIVPRLCAAFNRSTFLINGGDVQPSLSSDCYYSTSPTNHFSRIVHEYESDGKGYAFPYDDVNPSGEDQSGTVSARDPLVLAIRVGGV
ncbi:glycoside hydrolase family 64 protein [Cadophora sp. DSE1049]|nr:glycoside hydrolase family 64 protein [Cadophora sp. DSE1049]